jgi:hypothetical protein
MALTPDTWYVLSFAALADPPWTAPNSNIPAAIVDAIVNATDVYCFCLADDGTHSTLAFKGGVAIVPDAAITVSATPLMNTTVMDDGETWYSVRGPSLVAEWFFYGTQSGVVRTLADPTTLGAFIG